MIRQAIGFVRRAINSFFRKNVHLVTAFHGTDADSAQSILGDAADLTSGGEGYLGSGLYFWEKDYEQAKWWVTSPKAPKTPIDSPRILRACLNLEECLDLTTNSGRAEYEGLLRALLEDPTIRARYIESRQQEYHTDDGFFLNLLREIGTAEEPGNVAVRAMLLHGNVYEEDRRPRSIGPTRRQLRELVADLPEDVDGTADFWDIVSDRFDFRIVREANIVIAVKHPSVYVEKPRPA